MQIFCSPSSCLSIFLFPFSSSIHRSDRHQATDQPMRSKESALANWADFSKQSTPLCTHTLALTLTLTRSCSSPAASSGLLIKPFNLLPLPAATLHDASFITLLYHTCVPGHALQQICSPMFLASILVRQFAWRHGRNRTRHSHPQ